MHTKSYRIRCSFLSSMLTVATVFGSNITNVFVHHSDIDPSAVELVTICRARCCEADPWERITIDASAWNGGLWNSVDETCATATGPNDVWGRHRHDYVLKWHGTRAQVRTNQGFEKDSEEEKTYWKNWIPSCPSSHNGRCCCWHDPDGIGVCCGDGLHPAPAPTPSPVTPAPVTPSPVTPVPTLPQCFTTVADDLNYADVFTFCDQFDSIEDKCCYDTNTGLVGDTACSLWSTGFSHTVCKGACHGNHACRLWRRSGYADINACHGQESCFDLVAPVTVGANSCHNTTACSGIGYEDSNEVEIESESCIGLSACWGLGSPAFIGTGSCIGNNTCLAVGGDSEQVEIEIQSNSCKGIEACYQLGIGANDIQVQNSACIGDLSCFLVGSSLISGSVLIEEGACDKMGSCQYVGLSPLATSVTIAEGACNETEYACEFCFLSGIGPLIISDCQDCL